MNPYKRPSAKTTADLAQRRVVAVLECLKVLCPSADLPMQRQLATEILTLVRGQDPPVHQKTISPAAVHEMFTRNSQCVLNPRDRCPLLVFTKQLCDELNEYFRED